MKLYLKNFIIGHRKKIPLLLAAAFVLAFIWSNSMMPAADSSLESGWITNNIINPVLKLVGLSVKDGFVRKCAHVTEYLVMSVLVSLIWDCQPIRSYYSCFTIAFLDETIQALGDRGPMITDVWIDTIGVVLGYGIAALIYFKRKKASETKRENAEK